MLHPQIQDKGNMLICTLGTILKCNDMGYIIQAVCICGLKSEEFYQGIGFRYFEDGSRMEPAYCDPCGVVIGRDISKRYSKCPQCRKKVRLYKDDVKDVEEREVEMNISLITDNYIEEKELWHCPGCKRETLRFEHVGLWD